MVARLRRSILLHATRHHDKRSVPARALQREGLGGGAILLWELQATAARSRRLTVLRNRLDRDRARSDTGDWVQQRRARTRQLIELGGGRVTDRGKASRPLPAPTSEDANEPIAAVEAMITELGPLRQCTQDRALLGAYQGALDRLDALAYRLKLDAGCRTIRLPSRQAPKPLGAARQRALALGPVVVARKPKRR